MTTGNRFNEEAFARATERPNAHKAALVKLLHRYQKLNGLTITEPGEAGGVAQVTLSRLFGGNLAQASTDKLLKILTALGVHIAIQVDLNPPEGCAGRVEVNAARETVRAGDARRAISDHGEKGGS